MERLAKCLLTLITFNHMSYSKSPRTQVAPQYLPLPLVAIGTDVPRFSVVDVNLRRRSTSVTGAQALWILYV